VATTRSVGNFVGRATLEGLSGQPVFDDTFEQGRAMDHIAWAQWADLVVACPASASLIARFANGLADDAATTLWQACWARRAPQFIVPAMNTHMWDYPATQENLARLRGWGIHVLPTATGELACGETGAGRMLEPQQIREQIDAVLNFDRPRSGKRLLVTGGGTREAIDAVRYIGNHSAGRTAASLVDALVRRGHEVTWLGGAGAAEPQASCRRERFASFHDLEQQLQTLLGGATYHGVIHAAAVSDFSVSAALEESAAPGKAVPGQPDLAPGKLASGDAMTLHLAPNPKLLDQLRDYAQDPQLRVVGFKLTAGADEAAARAAVNSQFDRGSSDLVVHNEWQDIVDGRHGFALYNPDGSALQARDADELARRLGQFMEAPSLESYRQAAAEGQKDHPQKGDSAVHKEHGA
jgi:phosphopantothenoylcysteine decarboxylase/phosphopantothenate--cysteine ligase